MKTYSIILGEGQILRLSMDTLEECAAVHKLAQERMCLLPSDVLHVHASEGRQVVGHYSETAGLVEVISRAPVSEYERLEGRLHREGQALDHVQIGWHKTPCTKTLPGSPVVLGCLKANGEPRTDLLCWESGSEDLRSEKTTCITRKNGTNIPKSE